jgi:diguanylate cyclase (GGDEF)-like protein
LRDDRGEIAGTMGIAVDVSERKAAEERLAFLAHHDALTGVPNRLLLMDRLVQSIAHAKRRNRYTAVLFVDVDHFKRVNDTFGHSTGDELLKAIAQRLCAAVRPGDTVARLGGDEFIVALDDVAEANDVAMVAKKIVASFIQPFDANGNELVVTCSVGASLYPIDANSPDKLIRCADIAMYSAKELGRNTIQFYVESE